MTTHPTRAREALMQRRYRPGKLQKPRRAACLWPRDAGGFPQMLTGHADQSKTRSGCLYNRRIRLIRRFKFSPFRAPLTRHA